MKRKDSADDILDAFSGKVPREDLSPEKLDAVYSEALSQGALTEDEVRSAFAKFLERGVISDPLSGEPALAARSAPNVGEWIRAYRELRGLTREQLAQQCQLVVAQVVSLEECTEPYAADRLPDVAKAVGASSGVPVVRIHTLLQSIRATNELKDASGPTLMAARKVPPK